MLGRGLVATGRLEPRFTRRCPHTHTLGNFTVHWGVWSSEPATSAAPPALGADPSEEDRDAARALRRRASDRALAGIGTTAEGGGR